METMRNRHSLIVLVAAILSLAIPAKAGLRLKDLGTLSGDVGSWANAINERGEIVGFCVDSNWVTHAFYYRNGRMMALSSHRSTATAINDAGQIVGDILTLSTNIVYIGPPILSPDIVFSPTNIPIAGPNPPDIRSVPRNIIQPSTVSVTEKVLVLQPIGGSYVTNITMSAQPVSFNWNLSEDLFEGTNSGVALGINDHGEITGTVVGNDLIQRAFIYENGLTTDLPSLDDAPPMVATCINNHGHAAGFTTIGFSTSLYTVHPFLYSDGTMTDLGTLGGDMAGASAINDLDEVVGWSQTTSNSYAHAFLYRQGQMNDLGTLGDDQSYSSTNSLLSGTSWAYAINNWGDIVGVSTTTNGQHAFIYSDGTMTDLNNLVKLTHINGPPGFLMLGVAAGINDRGQIVGTGTYWNGVRETSRAFLLEWRPTSRRNASR